MNVRIHAHAPNSSPASSTGEPDSVRSRGCDVHRRPADGFTLDRDDRLLEAEGREQTVRIERVGEGDGGSLELSGEVDPVHCVEGAGSQRDRIGGFGRLRLIRFDRLGFDRLRISRTGWSRVAGAGGWTIERRERIVERREAHNISPPDQNRSVSIGRTVFDCPVDRDIDRDHVTSAVGERASDASTVTDADFQQSVVPVQPIDEGLTRGGYHGAGFMIAAVKSGSMLVDIVPVGEVTPRVKREASAALRSVYDCDVTVHDDQAVPENAYDSDRGQYRAEDLIEVVGRVGSGEKNIGITPRDLYYRRRNYVFGLAYLNGSGSVISTHRLRTSSDGGVSTKPAVDVFADRVRKEVVHEIGHTLGLEHCDNNKCVMCFSPTVREVDVKEENLCGSCSRLVR